jgi:zinc protease
VKKYFESIPSQPAPPRPDISQPEQRAERRKQLEDPFAQLPRIDIMYRIPAGDSPDYYPLSVLSRVLSGGQSSRLYQKLVKDAEVASNANAFANQRPGPSLERISVTVRPGKDLASVEKMVYDEIAKLQTQPVEDWEMDKVRMTLRRTQVASAQSTLNRAANLAQTYVEYGDVNLVNTEYQKLESVTKADITRVAKKYLVETNRSVIITLPKAKPAAPAGK